MVLKYGEVFVRPQRSLFLYGELNFITSTAILNFWSEMYYFLHCYNAYIILLTTYHESNLLKRSGYGFKCVWMCAWGETRSVWLNDWQNSSSMTVNPPIQFMLVFNNCMNSYLYNWDFRKEINSIFFLLKNTACCERKISFEERSKIFQAKLSIFGGLPSFYLFIFESYQIAVKTRSGSKRNHR